MRGYGCVLRRSTVVLIHREVGDGVWGKEERRERERDGREMFEEEERKEDRSVLLKWKFCRFRDKAESHFAALLRIYDIIRRIPLVDQM